MDKMGWWGSRGGWVGFGGVQGWVGRAGGGPGGGWVGMVGVQG